jgi:sigma-B regulation protein RsbQ
VKDLDADSTERVQTWAPQLTDTMGVARYPVIARGFMKSTFTIDPEHIQRIFLELIDYEQRPTLPLIAAKTLLIRGNLDKFVPGYCV